MTSIAAIKALAMINVKINIFFIIYPAYHSNP